MSTWESEWSRHYDQVQWAATTILTTASSGLLAWMWTRGTNDFNWIIGLLGAWLTLLTAYYAASFRALRHTLHNRMNTDEGRFLRGHRRRSYLPQWPLFFFTLAAVELAWLHLFWESGMREQAIVGGIVASPVFAYIFWRGQGESENITEDSGPNNSSV